ncbi:LysR substrate-binding domain-containing protein [Bacterioplanoides sp. SCSIO 12839]|uniref:LysR substrate-binding domain-containing protein n=1 Tax=Bacterioplanoides sp. SCSIO 12839 TaxID=2829569 RepID=UPI00210267B5|nr:LysR substrate-binding domain-containing protein [Bacterioplanoides sp. SCSIO 12839]UTW47371.1 LysR family transcriptional regulator [Bacterioplanoides sp. SCSIO 12839]
MSLPNLSSEVLRTFVAVVEQQGFIRAAESLHKTQSTISQQMKKLEQEVGVPLFKTLGRKRVLTHEGEMMLGYARRLLALQDDAIASLQSSGLQGEVRIGVSQGIAELMLPDLLAEFARQNPAIRLYVETGYSPALHQGFDNDEYDLIMTVSLQEMQGSGDLLNVEPLAWIGAPGWQWSGQRELPIAAYTSNCQFRIACLEALKHHDIPWRLVYTSSSYQGLMAAVKSGLAVTVRPQSAAADGGELVGERLGLPALPSVYSWLRYRPGFEAGRQLADSLKRASLKAR